MIDLTKQGEKGTTPRLDKVLEYLKTCSAFTSKLGILDEIRTMNNPLLLYNLDSSHIYELRLMLDPERLENEFPIETLRKNNQKGVDLYSGELIATKDASDTQLYDNLIISRIFPVIRLFAMAINRMTPAIKNEVIKPGDTGWAEIKLLVERWDDIPAISRLIDAGAIRPISGCCSQILNTPDDWEKAFTSRLHPGMNNDQKDVIRFTVLIKCIREMGVGRCAALAEEYEPKTLEYLKKLDNDIAEFFRNR